MNYSEDTAVAMANYSESTAAAKTRFMEAVENLETLHNSESGKTLDILLAEQKMTNALAEYNDAIEAEYYGALAESDEPLMAFLDDPYVKRISAQGKEVPAFGFSVIVTSKDRKASLTTLEKYVIENGKQFAANPRWQFTVGNFFALLVARKVYRLGTSEAAAKWTPDKNLEGTVFERKVRAYLAQGGTKDSPLTYEFATELFKKIISALMGDEVAEKVEAADVEYISDGLSSWDKKFGSIKFVRIETLCDELVGSILRLVGKIDGYSA